MARLAVGAARMDNDKAGKDTAVWACGRSGHIARPAASSQPRMEFSQQEACQPGTSASAGCPAGGVLRLLRCWPMSGKGAGYPAAGLSR